MRRWRPGPSGENGSTSDLDLDILIFKAFHKVGDGGFFDP